MRRVDWHGRRLAHFGPKGYDGDRARKVPGSAQWLAARHAAGPRTVLIMRKGAKG